MSQRYSLDELRGIGQVCSARLPPATAMQAMLLYELQRDAEHEELFQSQFFKFAKQDTDIQSLVTRVGTLEGQVEELKRGVKIKDLEKRHAILTIRTDAGHARQHSQQSHLESNTTRLIAVEQAVKTLQTQLQDNTVQLLKQLNQALSNVHALQSSVSALQTSFASLDDHIGVLFDERDSMVSQLQQASDRLAALENSSSTMAEKAAGTAKKVDELEESLSTSLTLTNEGVAVAQAAHVQPLKQMRAKLGKRENVTAKQLDELNERLLKLERSSSQTFAEAREEMKELRNLFKAYARQNAGVGLSGEFPSSSSSSLLGDSTLASSSSLSSPGLLLKDSANAEPSGQKERSKSPTTQRLRVVSASNGLKEFDLSVAKGSGFVGSKENRQPSLR